MGRFFFIQLLSIILLLNQTLQLFAIIRYPFELNLGNPHNLCPKNKTICDDNSTNYMCTTNNDLSLRCKNFEDIPNTKIIIQDFVNTHNGIRNKVAEDFKISNMNLVHWSHPLEEMATRFLRECLIGDNPCKFVGELPVPVNSNYLLRKQALNDRWPGRIVRQWYLEIGYDVHTWPEFIVARQNGKMNNFTQLIWPSLAFIGCAVAKMFDGFLVVCLYNPPYNVSELGRIPKFGRTCSDCNRNRLACSKTFDALCGIDVPFDDNAPICGTNGYLLLISLLVCVKI